MKMKLVWLVCAAVLAGCSTRIQHGLDEKSANELQTVLLAQGIKAERTVEPGKKPTWAISVPDGQAESAVQLLATLGLPKSKARGFADMKSSLVPTPMEQQVQFLELLAGELEQTLEATEGVLSARVHIVIAPPSRAGQPALPSRASALLKVRPGMAPRVLRLSEDLKSLIAGGVQGLSSSDVALVVDEVVLPPARDLPAVQPWWLRWLAAGLAGVVTLLSVVLVAVGLQLRAGRRAPPVAAAAPTKTPMMPAPRASTATAPARKVA